jgi:uracil-DNA glycosylase family 4
MRDKGVACEQCCRRMRYRAMKCAYKRCGASKLKCWRANRCPLAQTRTCAVPGEGNLNAVAMFVGEGPGADEDRQGRPFVGRSGQFLTETLAQLGIARRDVYITNVVKCRPPQNRDPLPAELDACRDYLTRQVEIDQPAHHRDVGAFQHAALVSRGRDHADSWACATSGADGLRWRCSTRRRRCATQRGRPPSPQDMAKLPALIERAQRANAAAARGEALLAGAPHPGDDDYVAKSNFDAHRRRSGAPVSHIDQTIH